MPLVQHQSVPPLIRSFVPPVNAMREIHIHIYKNNEQYVAEIIAPADRSSSFPVPDSGFPCTLVGSPQTLEESRTKLLQIPADGGLNQVRPIGKDLYRFLFGPSTGRNTLYVYWQQCWQESKRGWRTMRQPDPAPDVMDATNMRTMRQLDPAPFDKVNVNGAPQDEDVRGMRTVLHLDPSSSELIGAPWELLCSDETDQFLIALPDATPHTLVRNVWSISPEALEPVPLGPNEPLRVLFVLGTTEAQIKACDEVMLVDIALHRRMPWQIDTHVLVQPTLMYLRDWCRRWKPHVFHFVGHATVFDEPALVLQMPPQVSPGKKPPNDMLLSIGDVADLFAAMPQLIILNACRTGQPGIEQSAKAAEATKATEAAEIFASILIKRGVAAAMTMQADIQGEAAALMMKTFYCDLARGKALDEALFSARDFVKGCRAQAPYQDWEQIREWDWLLPTLYVAEGQRIENIVAVTSEEEDITMRVLSMREAREDRHKLPLSVAVRIQIGYDQQQLDLEDLFVGPPTFKHIPPITVLRGEKNSGKTTLMFWLAECCARRNHPFLYADFGDDEEARKDSRQLNYWDMLRLIRDGQSQKVRGVRLNNGIEPNRAFCRFNDTLNRKLIPKYQPVIRFEPDTEVADQTLGVDVGQQLAELGTVDTGAGPHQVLSNEFWADLQRLAQPNGLIIFLDHTDELCREEVQSFGKYLFRQVIEGESKIRIVLSQQMIPGAAPTNTWDFLESPPFNNQRFVVYRDLAGIPDERIRLLARVWARRYFRGYFPSHRPQTNAWQVLTNRLGTKQITDAHLDARVETVLDFVHGAPVLPGHFVEHMMHERDTTIWLQRVGLI